MRDNSCATISSRNLCGHCQHLALANKAKIIYDVGPEINKIQKIIRRQRMLTKDLSKEYKSLPQNTTKVLNSVDAIQTVVNRMIGYGYLTIDDENMLSSLQYGGDEEPVTSLPYLLRRFEK